MFLSKQLSMKISKIHLISIVVSLLCAYVLACSGKRSKIESILSEKNSCWDINDYDMDIVAYGYKFNRDNSLDYFIYDPIVMKKIIVYDEPKPTWRLDKDSIISYYRIKYKILDLNSDSILVQNCFSKELSVWIKTEDKFRNRTYPIQIYNYAEKRIPEQKKLIDSLRFYKPQLIPTVEGVPLW
jgi:hypothetical protein